MESLLASNKQDILFQNVFDENIEIKISSDMKKEVYIHFNHQSLKFETNYDFAEHLIDSFILVMLFNIFKQIELLLIYSMILVMNLLVLIILVLKVNLLHII